MLDNVLYQVLIDQALALLAAIHQALLTDPVNPAGDTGGLLINAVYSPVGEDLLPSPGIGQV